MHSSGPYGMYSHCQQIKLLLPYGLSYRTSIFPVFQIHQSTHISPLHLKTGNQVTIRLSKLCMHRYLHLILLQILFMKLWNEDKRIHSDMGDYTHFSAVCLPWHISLQASSSWLYYTLSYLVNGQDYIHVICHVHAIIKC